MCHGRANVPAFSLRSDGGSSYDPLHPCSTCTGLGKLTPERMAWWKRGNAHRLGRLERMESLAECARRLGITPSELSQIERGAMDPRILPDA